MNPPNPRLVLPNTAWRDGAIAVVCGAAILALIAFAMFTMGREQGAPSANHRRGVIVAKHFSGEKEQEISYGTKGLKAQETDSGYSLEIRVSSENRTYEVPVGKALYDSRKVGDEQDFIRPKSEQQ